MCAPFSHGSLGMLWIFPLFGLVCMTIFLLSFTRLLSGKTGRGSPFFGFRNSDQRAEAPEEIVRRRYAAGEITREQFDELLVTLRR